MIRLLALAASLQLLLSCAALQSGGPNTERASIQNQLTLISAQRLSDLEEIDALIKLDNRWLSRQIEPAFNGYAELSENFEFRNFKIKFSNQIINIEAIVNFLDDNENIVTAAVSGDILLEFRRTGLEWFPRIRQLEISSRDFTFEDKNYIESDPVINQQLLQHLNSDIAVSITEQKQNQIPISAIPLANIEVGASLPGFAQSPARHQQELKGVSLVAGSAFLIDTSRTTIALDMTFIPKLSVCPADVTISRAEFVQEVESREPVGIVSDLNSTQDIKYFYSEISGAKRPLTIIHYWFADGSPIAVEELAVGTSAHWRTWSAKGGSFSGADHLEVLVVEKESACILHSRSISKSIPESIIVDSDQSPARKTFSALQNQFGLRTSDFSISEDKPDIAMIEITRSFLSTVLQTSMADLNIGAEFDSSMLSSLQYSTDIQAFNLADIACEHRDCPTAPACSANLAQCKRLRDTRDCSSCLFRNPLNNRCMREAVDPLCEASRNRQNEKYDLDRATCIANAEISKQECEQLNAQALRSCQIESGFEGSACESVRTDINSLEQGSPMSTVSAKTRTTGTVMANFSNFRIEDKLGRLKLDMSLNSDLQQEGTLQFNPSPGISQTLSNCIEAWSAPFKSRFSTTPRVNNLLSSIEETGNTLSADWSGFGLSIETNPSPLESVFVSNSQLLANCKIGLTVNMVEESLSGEDAEFFRGHIDLEIQPLPTKIRLTPATIGNDANAASAMPQFGKNHLRYDFVE